VTDVYSLEAEQSVLASILMDAKDALPAVVGQMQPEDLYYTAHRQIFEAMLEMYHSNNGIDFVTLAEKIARVEVPGGSAQKYLLQMAQMVPSIANVKAYAEIVAKSARARKLQRIVRELDGGEITADNIDELTEELSAKIFEVGHRDSARGLQPLRAVLVKYIDSLTRITEPELQTGFGDLDAILKGLPRKNLILIAARPKIGKSAFALSIAQHVAQESGKTVSVFSCEMADEELAERMVSNQSGVSMDKLIDKDIEWNGALPDAFDYLSRLPIMISDDASVSVAQIRAQCRMIKNLGMIVVDYIQLMKASKKTENRTQEVSSISRELKLLAMDYNVPVIALSQLNRAPEGRSDKRPTPSDLRESGALEQDANKVILMWELNPNPNTTDDNRTMAVEVAYNRRGKRGIVQFNFDGAHMRYYQLVKNSYLQLGAPPAKPKIASGRWEQE
jgi:replicative DNA helicase